jgi:hypothetical protein
MPRQEPQAPGGLNDLLRALRDPSRSLRDTYKNDPVGLAKRFHLRLPEKPAQTMINLGILTREEAVERFGADAIAPGLKALVEDVCTGRCRSAAAVANRGGGKSMGVSFIEFYLVFMEDYDALNLGGSELQADQVYQYIVSYIEAEPEFQALVKGDPLQSKTETHNNAWIRVLTASQKSVRSPHAGGRKKDGRMAGGLLVIDEEAEAAPDIVEAALPTINTARPSVNVRCSTFHNAEGTFAELIDNHQEMGYQLYKWDIFDVAEPCECGPDKCESEEKCFAEDHVEDYIDPDDGQKKQRIKHRAYCGGRARYADGWIPVNEIVTLWKRMKRNHSRWEVEAMGQRPSTAGFVLKDPVAYARNRVPSAADLYVPGWPVTICIDWGTVAAGLTVWQEQPGDRHALIECDQIMEAGQTQIVGAILSMRAKYQREFLEVAADIGGGGNYLNPLLREQYRVPVRDVNFGEEKEAAVAAWNIFNEAGKAKYPDEFGDFHQQAKNWKRKNGRIAKGNDHLMDSSVCYFSKFIDRLGLSNVRIAPRAFSAGMEVPRAGSQPTTRPRVGTMRPIMRSFGSSRR